MYPGKTGDGAAADHDYFCGIFRNALCPCDVSANDTDSQWSKCLTDVWIMLFFTVAILLFICAVLGFTKPRLGLIASPLLAIAFGVLAVALEDEYFIIAAPVIFFVGLAGVCWSNNTGSAAWPRIIAKSIFAACGVVFLVVLGFALFGQGGLLGLVIFLLFGGAVISAVLTSRFATAAYVISTISASMRQNLPLPMALESAAAGRSDKRAMILLRIKNWLVEGYSLSESIKRGYPKCPGYAVSLIAAGEEINQLPQAVKAIEADMLAKIDQSRKIQPVSQSYPTILLFFMFFIVLFLMTFVFPMYEQVLTELVEGTELPAATQLLMRITRFVAYGYGWLIGLFLFVLTVIAVPAYIRIRSRPRRPEKPYLTSRIGDIIKWRLPILHNSERNSLMLRLVERLACP